MRALINYIRLFWGAEDQENLTNPCFRLGARVGLQNFLCKFPLSDYIFQIYLLKPVLSVEVTSYTIIHIIWLFVSLSIVQKLTILVIWCTSFVNSFQKFVNPFKNFWSMWNFLELVYYYYYYIIVHYYLKSL